MSKPSSVSQTVRYLNGAFGRERRSLGLDNRKGTPLYQAEVEFCWLMNEIERGPDGSRAHKVAEANKLIAELSGDA